MSQTYVSDMSYETHKTNRTMLIWICWNTRTIRSPLIKLTIDQDNWFNAFPFQYTKKNKPVCPAGVFEHSTGHVSLIRYLVVRSLLPSVNVHHCILFRSFPNQLVLTLVNHLWDAIQCLTSSNVQFMSLTHSSLQSTFVDCSCFWPTINRKLNDQ